MRIVKLFIVAGVGIILALVLLVLLASRVPVAYRALAFVPLQQDVTFSRAGDRYFDTRNFEEALTYYQQAETHTSRPHKCTIYIKAGNTSNNLAIEQSQTDQQITYLQAASDQYGRCLSIDGDNKVAIEHKQIVDAALQKLLKQQADENPPQPMPQEGTIIPSSETDQVQTIHW